MLKYYYSKGVNKISIGIQDFDPEVKKNNKQGSTARIVSEGLLVPSRYENILRASILILWGTPKQTRCRSISTLDTEQ